jgi:hypothetical protein
MAAEAVRFGGEGGRVSDADPLRALPVDFSDLIGDVDSNELAGIIEELRLPVLLLRLSATRRSKS